MRDLTPVWIDTDDWARWPEVVNYAEAHKLSISDAIVQLVNSGLSHERRSYV